MARLIPRLSNHRSCGSIDASVEATVSHRRNAHEGFETRLWDLSRNQVPHSMGERRAAPMRHLEARCS